MSIELAANIAPSIPHMFAADGVRTWNREAPLFSMIQKTRGVSDAVYWTASKGGAAGANVYVGEGEAVNSATEYNVDDRTALTLSRAIVRNGFSISHRELAQVASLRSDIAADFVIQRLSQAWLDNLGAVARLMEVELLAGLGTATSNSTTTPCQGVVGLMAIFSAVINNAGSYAGVLVSSYSGLQPYVNSTSGALTSTMIDQMIAGIQNSAGSIKPNFLMCNPKTAVQLKKLGDGSVRLNSSGKDPKLPWQLGLREVPTVDEPVVYYNGIPVIQNSAWGSAYDGYLVTGRMEDLELNILPYQNWGDTISEEDKDSVEGFAGLLKRTGVPFFSWPVAKTASTVSYVEELEFQLKIKAPNRFGLLRGFTT